jgi:hypothetical protein
MAEDDDAVMETLSISVLANAPDPEVEPTADPRLQAPQPEGEVKAGASEPDQEPPSVEQNKPDESFDPSTIPDPRVPTPQPEGVVKAGANEPDAEPPSVVTRESAKEV